MAILTRGRWLTWLRPRRQWRVTVQVAEADLFPGRLPRRGAALAGPPNAPKWLALDCPCGGGHRIMVNLDRRRRPAWHVVNPRPLTVRPSLDVTHAGARCHFTITNGAVRWARPGQEPGGTAPATRPRSGKP